MRSPIIILSIVLLGCSALLLSGNKSGNDGIVQTDCGPIQGYQETYFNTTLWSFKGIPYAVPPLGKLRWQPPVSLKDGDGCWAGTYNANNFGAHCFQGYEIGKEDCLFLNVWTPINSSPDSLLPVMFYIHGGSLIEGSGYDIGQSPWRPATTGEVISVSINYRLNAFGYLALDILSKNDPRGTSGNYGLMDQILALQWVQNNIKAFGGDPSKVTIWGQSSGGTSVLQLLISPSAKNLFHGAISMSGSPNISVSLNDAEEMHTQNWLAGTKCYTLSNDELLQCLYSLSSDEVYNPVSQFNANWNPSWLFGLVTPNSTILPLSIVDGVTVPLSIWEAFATGAVNDVPTIFGVMAQESDLSPVDIVYDYTPQQFENFLTERFSLFGSEIAPQVMELYPLQEFDSPQEAYDSISADIGDNCGTISLGTHAAKGFKSNFYVYIGSVTPDRPLCFLGLGYCPRYAFHALDLFYIDNDFGFVWEMTGNDLKFSNLISSRFVEFAKYGNISSNAWIPFNNDLANGYTTVDLCLEEKSVVNVKLDKCNFWKENGFNTWFWQN